MLVCLFLSFFFFLFIFIFLLLLILFLFLSTGVPAFVVALSLSTAAGIDGIETFVSDEQ